MISKIKGWLKNHLVNKSIPLYVICGMIIVSFITVFLFYYKAPISLADKKDRAVIEKMVKEQNPTDKIESLEIKEGVVYVGLIDSIFKLSDKIKDESDIIWYTRVVRYRASSDSDTIKCITIFEVDEKFLKERVGKHLITVRNIE